MKKVLFALTTVAVMASCSQNNPRTAAETQMLKPTDTAGLSQFQAWKAQNELAVANQMAQANQLAAQQPTKEIVRERVVYVNSPRSTSSRSRARSSSSGSSGVYNSTSSNTARKK